MASEPAPLDKEALLRAIARAHRIYLHGPAFFRYTAAEFMDEQADRLIALSPPELPATITWPFQPAQQPIGKKNP